MSVVIECPSCGQKMKLPSESALGKKVQCPGCAERFVAAANLDYPVAPVVPKANPKADSDRPARPLPKPAPSDARSRPAAKTKVEAAPGARESSSRSKPSRKRPKDDEVLDVVEIVEEEDEWAGLAPAAPKKPKSSRLGEAPAVVGRKKRASESERRAQPGEGEMSIGQHRLLMIGTGLIGGLIAMAVWAAIIHWRGIGAGYLAVLVGLFVGGGVRLGASKLDYGWAPAITASVMTFMAIIGGKAVAYRVLNASAAAREQQARTTAYVALLEHENYHIQRIAERIIDTREKLDPEFDRFEGMDYDEDLDEISDLPPEKIPKQYPPAIWKEATEKWAELSEEEKKKQRDEADDKVARAKAGQIDDEKFQTQQGKEPLFDILDIFWLLLSISAAFRLATGQNE
ncbi:MAG: hypothetical protein IT428_33470 [Planctomycetaceae bacterium]|nr:hypothetical protein [Planctomycetaceae bacterium]